MLRSADKAALDALGLTYEAEDEGGHTNITIKDYALPAGMTPAVTDLLLRIPGGFPDAQPDMFWLAEQTTNPHGARPPATESIETYVRRPWVRWSRHINTWRPGTDDLTSYILFVRHCLEFEARAAA